jgi:hypothetical protein
LTNIFMNLQIQSILFEGIEIVFMNSNPKPLKVCLLEKCGGNYGSS